MVLCKYVYTLGGGTAEDDKSIKNLLGGKGANLSEMSSIGLSIPPGFIHSAEVCKYHNEDNEQWPDGLEEELQQSIAQLEQLMDLEFGDSSNPLLVSVRYLYAGDDGHGAGPGAERSVRKGTGQKTGRCRLHV